MTPVHVLYIISKLPDFSFHSLFLDLLLEFRRFLCSIENWATNIRIVAR